MPNDAQSIPSAAALALRYGAPATPAPAWNETLETLLDHRSVRSYLPDALAPGTIETLVAAAQSASTSSNLQVWSVIAVQDPARRARLSALASNQKHITQAPLFLVWLADLSRAARIAERAAAPLDALPFAESFVLGVVDAALAAQNAAVAAESLGLGVVYIGGLRNKPAEVAAELGLPPQVMAVFGLCVGHPDRAVATDVKPRLPQSVVLHHERYDAAPDADGIAAYDARLRHFQHGQGMAEIGWTASVLNRLKGPFSLSGRDRLRQIIAGLGFPLR
jgi:nitroreductase